MTYYQQGDVKLHPCNPESMVSTRMSGWGQGAVQLGQHAADTGDLVLAEGEATGHAHRVDMDAATTEAGAKAEVRALGAQRFLIVTGGSITLTHEEHGPQVIEIGTYRVDIVKEYDPFVGVTRFVAD